MTRNAWLLVLAFWASTSTAADRPNIIYIMADDQGYGDLGCQGARDLHTPHIDRMAEEGLRFDRFYAAAPVCSPMPIIWTTMGGNTPDALRGSEIDSPPAIELRLFMIAS